MTRRIALCVLLLWSGLARAATVVDATGRSVQVPDHIAHVLPAGPPAAILLAALAPDLMMGWTSPISAASREMLGSPAADLPLVPRITGHDDVAEKVRALAPDVIIDYGTVSPRYVDLARNTQQRTGIPTILLDGSLDKVPQVMRLLGGILHREERGETLARLAEAMLATPARREWHPTVVYARGTDGLTVVAPGADVTTIFARLGWRQVAPPGDGPLRPSTVEQIRDLDPDVIIFADPAMASAPTRSADWQSLRAVRDGHAFAAPTLPFGWLEEPPSINRLLGVAWLGGGDPTTLATLFNAVAYGHVLTAAQRDAALAGVRTVQP